MITLSEACAHMRSGNARVAQLVNLKHFRGVACHAILSDHRSHTQNAEHVLTVSDTDLGGQAKGKLRLDAFLSARLPNASRARLQASIKQGLVLVNGRPGHKPSLSVRPGDTVAASVLAPPPLEAAPEAGLPLEVVYEDEHLLVVNKAAGMVMHPSAGHHSGTLVNALLHHCGLPPMQLAGGAAAPLSLEGVAAAAAAAAAAAGVAEQPAGGGRRQQGREEGEVLEGEAVDIDILLSDDGDDDDGDLDGEDDGDDEGPRLLLVPPPGLSSPLTAAAAAAAGVVRPGIVHRLDRGTTGLLVVAKTDAAHASLAAQFKARQVSRAYLAVTLGVPSPWEGRVAANVGRDLRDRKKMAAFAYGAARGRLAASRYRVLEALAGGAAALVEWRLETGRTHQIRVHSRHLGHPLFGDETYGGGSAAAATALSASGAARRTSSSRAVAGAAAAAVARELARPALHAATLGFQHPASGMQLMFEAELPADFQAALSVLRSPPLAGSTP